MKFMKYPLMKNKKMTRLLLSAFGTVFAFASAQCFAGLIAYEPFDYPAGTTDPGFDETKQGAVLSEGGTGFVTPKTMAGWQALTVVAPGLEYSETGKLKVQGNAALAPAGNSAIYQLYKSQGGDPFEELRNPDKPEAFGKPGSTLWISFLFCLTGEINNQSVAILKFGQNNLSLGVCNNERSDGPYFRLSGPRSKIQAESGRTYLLVARITYGEHTAPDDRTDTVEAWINPELGGEEPPGTADAVIGETRAVLSDFWIATNLEDGTTAVFDEFRVGETYADVVPVQ
jgi:hypothetical protein